MGRERTVAGLRYLPRQGDIVNGTIKAYEFFVSDDPKNLGSPAAKGSFSGGSAEKQVRLEGVRKGRYIALRALSEVNDQPWTSIAEIGILSE